MNYEDYRADCRGSFRSKVLRTRRRKKYDFPSHPPPPDNECLMRKVIKTPYKVSSPSTTISARTSCTRYRQLVSSRRRRRRRTSVEKNAWWKPYAIINRLSLCFARRGTGGSVRTDRWRNDNDTLIRYRRFTVGIRFHERRETSVVRTTGRTPKTNVYVHTAFRIDTESNRPREMYAHIFIYI